MTTLTSREDFSFHQLVEGVSFPEQTRYDSVQGRPNRAAIQPPATGSLVLAQSPPPHSPSSQGQEGRELAALKENFPRVPVRATSDVSFCYHEFQLADKKGNVLAACGGVLGKIWIWGVLETELKWGREGSDMQRTTAGWNRTRVRCWPRPMGGTPYQPS
ncbi:unnamed protein product [Pleuronectes platessa]|uniref:Uncharacterized protein n=1 Tax=Pleuronectes platessa TaxID=8262 RepID=A0A9N7YLZ5_PLEPL|nr:unnamed protein product [Pleuronectes platessa]